ncbi:MAG: SpoIID/LytB domain-containing protein [Firmicutes bacterium]|nr:SpoIID/LytB domain-containing protein [Bacillota bacterium]
MSNIIFAFSGSTRREIAVLPLNVIANEAKQSYKSKIAALLSEARNDQKTVRVRIFSLQNLREFIIKPSSKLEVSESGEKKPVFLKTGEKTEIKGSGDKIFLKSKSGVKTFAGVIYIKSKSPLIVRSGGRDKKIYCNLKVSWTGKNLILINRMPVESYVAGVTDSEFSFSGSTEAWKAQAVVARSYAVACMGRHKKEGYDFCDSTHCQNFRGLSSRDSAGFAAAGQTKGLILKYKGKPLSAFYHSTCGGKTAEACEIFTEPADGIESIKDFLEGKTLCRNSPHFKWKSVVSKERLLSALQSDELSNPGKFLAKIEVPVRGKSGRARMVKITGEKVKILPGYQFWLILGNNLGWGEVESTWFDVKKSGNDFIFEGRGCGHGLGMCQWGAAEMGRSGASFRQILKHYYPEAEIGNI